MHHGKNNQVFFPLLIRYITTVWQGDMSTHWISTAEKTQKTQIAYRLKGIIYVVNVTASAYR